MRARASKAVSARAGGGRITSRVDARARHCAYAHRILTKGAAIESATRLLRESPTTDHQAKG